MVAKEQFNVYVPVPVAHPDAVVNLGQFNGDSRDRPIGPVELNSAPTRVSPNNYDIARLHARFLVADSV